MFYNNYGGRAFRNGKHIEGRNDAFITAEGVKSTPGHWPGWAFEEAREDNSYHVLLGDGPIFVGLYKQATIAFQCLDKKIDLLETEHDIPQSCIYELEGKPYLPLTQDFFMESENPVVFKFKGYMLEIFIRLEFKEGCFIYVRLTQPDGVVWTGWNGYTGSGHEDGNPEFSFEKHDQKLAELFSEKLKI